MEQDLELISELFEQGEVERPHLFRVHAALETFGNDVGQGNDG
jgi:hypothetical protein